MASRTSLRAGASLELSSCESLSISRPCSVSRGESHATTKERVGIDLTGDRHPWRSAGFRSSRLRVSDAGGGQGPGSLACATWTLSRLHQNGQGGREKTKINSTVGLQYSLLGVLVIKTVTLGAPCTTNCSGGERTVGWNGHQYGGRPPAGPVVDRDVRGFTAPDRRTGGQRVACGHRLAGSPCSWGLAECRTDRIVGCFAPA